jgi:tetratricopeptide (TPR) repeat protein
MWTPRAGLVLATLLGWIGLGAPAAGAEPPTASYAGRAACAGCHEKEQRLWLGSHHDGAMQKAGDETVLGDFGDAEITHDGVTSHFSHRDGKYLIRTQGPDGAMHEYEVAYTFGVAPLQQYLIALPGGRLQAYDIAWDTRTEAEGGRRWFPLQPDEHVGPGDVLHWSGPANNWNSMCADCHSTNLRKNYDLGRNRYDTKWSEIDVSCEACHGPGSRHVAWARSREGTPAAAVGAGVGLTVRLKDAKPAAWVMDPESGIARRSRPRASHAELETCAPCHSRRSIIDAPQAAGRPYLDADRPALLEAGLYHADGQIDGEVYVYGSFLQSRMYRAGVTCSNCHDPHSLALRASGNLVCAQCHLASRFDTPAHHFHPPDSPGARCVECHMPAKLYMVIDARRDHSLRIPRPDLTVEIGTPNACNGCHADRDAKWAARAVERWYGARKRGGFARAIHSGREILAGADAALAAVVADAGQPAIARATAVELLQELPTSVSRRAVGQALSDPDPLVRMAAAGAAPVFGAAVPLEKLFRLLDDPRRAVRVEAARVLAPLDRAPLPADRHARLVDALREYRHAQEVNAERPDAHVNLALLETQLGDLDAAEREYRTALRLAPYFVPAYVNLADLLRLRGREQEGEKLLRRALEVAPDGAAAHHALGLLLVRQGRKQAAVEELRKASQLAPDNARYAYVHGVAMHSMGKTDEALEILRANHQRHTGHSDTLLALATISRDAGETEQALEYARRLAAFAPDDAAVRALVRELTAEKTATQGERG